MQAGKDHSTAQPEHCCYLRPVRTLAPAGRALIMLATCSVVDGVSTFATRQLRLPSEFETVSAAVGAS